MMALGTTIRPKSTTAAIAAVFAAVTVVQCAAPTSIPDRDTPVTAHATPPTSTPSSSAPPAPGTVHTITAAELGATWRPGCPVPPERLRRLELTYLGFDGRAHRGDLVVNEDVVPDVVAIFAELYRQGFPIERMRTVDAYPGASDELSMRDDNTSAFNCRPLPGSDRWSLHAFGRAIDLNPLLNPYVGGRGEIQPGTAGPYLDRTRPDRGLIGADDPVVRTFLDRGWRWGGNWRTPKDYQHFEKR